MKQQLHLVSNKTGIVCRFPVRLHSSSTTLSRLYNKYAIFTTLEQQSLLQTVSRLRVAFCQHHISPCLCTLSYDSLSHLKISSSLAGFRSIHSQSASSSAQSSHLIVFSPVALFEVSTRFYKLRSIIFEAISLRLSTKPSEYTKCVFCCMHIQNFLCRLTSFFHGGSLSIWGQLQFARPRVKNSSAVFLLHELLYC